MKKLKCLTPITFKVNESTPAFVAEIGQKFYANEDLAASFIERGLVKEIK
jgi:hypothetical protein